MITKELLEEIAILAETTPEIVEAVLSAYYQIRYVPVEPRSATNGVQPPAKCAVTTQGGNDG